ncbi:MAG: hypothetical protein EHM43_05345 [Ignavibacteriae bacterium]|nr:MAG: hypothetical protein EHM43_05345 [Ignavibacteriota bacterium]
MITRFITLAALALLVAQTSRSQTTRDQSVMLRPRFNGAHADSVSVTWTPPEQAQTATQTYWIAEQNDEVLSFMLEPPRADWWFDVPASRSSWMEVSQTWQVNDLRMMASGYVQAGTTRTGMNLATSRRVEVIVDEEAANALENQLQRLVDDLQREGWVAVIRTTSPNSTPRSIKRDLILPAWSDTTQGKLSHILLLGDIPYAMSGGFSVKGAAPNPDFHPEHGGAWTADAYYADTETSTGIDAEYQWTDETVNMPGPDEPNRPENANVPGDGKFDQSLIPTDLELCVGRVDMRNLPVFGTTAADRQRELALLRQYLERDHAYRTRNFEPPYRAIIDDNFGLFARVNDGYRVIEAFAASGYRSFSPVVGPDSIFEGDWIYNSAQPRRTLDSTPSLFAYGCGGGGYAHCSGVAEEGELAEHPVYAAFTLLFGSYFADVNSTDNIMRSTLAADGWVLTCGWSGRPHWFLHGMADGATIGECQRLSANNAGRYIGGTIEDLATGQFAPFVIGERYIHTLLLGDPTLTLQGPVIGGMLNVQEIPTTGETYLSWNTSPQHRAGLGSEVAYLIEAGPSLQGPLTAVDTVAPGTRLMAEARVLLPNNAAVVRVRPYFTNSGRLAPLSGRGVIAFRTVSSVAEPWNDEPGHYMVLDILGRPVLTGSGTRRQAEQSVQSSDLPAGAYLVINADARAGSMVKSH